MSDRETTTVLPVDVARPDGAVMDRAGLAIRAARLVAFPTETVYGLGAAALDAAAVARIFAAKGRPATNPLIVHVADMAAARELATVWTDEADRLAAAFWPGPLSIVLPKRPNVPDITTAGGATVALRVPAHPVALALVRAAGVPIAAPSANRSNHVSPTTAAHVMDDLSGRVDLILDAGPSTGGLESTVVNLASPRPVILRQGLVTAEQLARVLGRDVPLARESRAPSQAPSPIEAPLPSPGMLTRHYAPRVTLCVATREEIVERLRQRAHEGKRAAWLTLGEEAFGQTPPAHGIVMPRDAAGYASRLYAALREAERAEVDIIFLTRPPEGDDWSAIHDRLRRAATP